MFYVKTKSENELIEYLQDNLNHIFTDFSLIAYESSSIYYFQATLREEFKVENTGDKLLVKAEYERTESCEEQIIHCYTISFLSSNLQKWINL